MSAKQTGLVWELDLPHNEAWVLMAMADHADHEGHNVYPGVPLLAWKTGYTTRQVRRILAILQGKGLIVVEQEGGGRKTTRYRLELSTAQRKDPHHPGNSRSGKRRDHEQPEPREVKMSPLAPDVPMSPQGGKDVRAPRTQLCHPNRHGREAVEPSLPPPSLPSPVCGPEVASTTPSDGNGEGGRIPGRYGLSDGEVNGAPGSAGEAIRAAYYAWISRSTLPPDQRGLLDRQADRLASGEDGEAWRHPQNGAVVPVEDRPRIFGLGMHYLGGGTSHTLRGGVMYAVAKHYRAPPPVPGSEHAEVLARGTAGEAPGRNRLHCEPRTAPVPLAALLAESGATRTPEVDSIERWEREHPEECAQLRDQVARQTAADAGGRKISDQILRIIGRTQYRHLVLLRIQALDDATQRE